MTALTSCAAQSVRSPTVEVPTTVATAASRAVAPPPKPPSSQFNARGNIVEDIGDTGGWGGPEGATVGSSTVTFVVDKITVDPTCSAQFARGPENGHFVQLDIRVETTPQMSEDESLGFTPSSFSTVGVDGLTESTVYSSSSFGCLAPSAQLPGVFTPASKYRGSVVLDTRNASGILVFRHPAVTAGGWEWAYGSA